MPTHKLQEDAKRHFYSHYGVNPPAPGYTILVNGKVWKAGYGSGVRAFSIARKLSRQNTDKEYTVTNRRGMVINRLVNGVDQLELDS